MMDCLGKKRRVMLERFGLTVAKLAVGVDYRISIDQSPDRFGCLLVSVRLDEIGVPRAWVPDLAYLLEEDPFFIDPVASALIARHCRQLHDYIGAIPQAVLQRMATAMGVSAVAWQDDSFVIEFPVRFLLGALDWEFAHLE